MGGKPDLVLLGDPSYLATAALLWPEDILAAARSFLSVQGIRLAQGLELWYEPTWGAKGFPTPLSAPRSWTCFLTAGGSNMCIQQSPKPLSITHSLHPWLSPGSAWENAHQVADVPSCCLMRGSEHEHRLEQACRSRRQERGRLRTRRLLPQPEPSALQGRGLAHSDPEVSLGAGWAGAGPSPRQVEESSPALARAARPECSEPFLAAPATSVSSQSRTMDSAGSSGLGLAEETKGSAQLGGQRSSC